jgi:hypothetical protein
VAGSRILTILEDRVSDQLGVFFAVTGMYDLPKEDDDIFHAGVLGDFAKVVGIKPDRIERLNVIAVFGGGKPFAVSTTESRPKGCYIT